MIEEIKKDIIKAYGSLVDPDWSFVSKRSQRGLYDDLAADMAHIFSVQETTDLNDDCSRSFFLSSGIDAMTLRVSLVGLYACAHDERGIFFSEKDFLINSFSALLVLLKAKRISLLNDNLLRQKIDFYKEQKNFYELLFSEDEFIS